jgi:hypothetical protein
VNNKSDIKGFKALIVIRSEKEHITNNKSLWVLAAKKANKRTNTYNRTYNFRPVRPKGEDSPNSILK